MTFDAREHICFNVGRVMRSPVGDVAKMDYAINAVLLLPPRVSPEFDASMVTIVQRAERLGDHAFNIVQAFKADRIPPSTGTKGDGP